MVDFLRNWFASLLARRRRAPARAVEQRWQDPIFRDVLDAAPDAMVVVDAEGRIRLVNTQAELMLGWSREELLAMHVEALVPGAFRDAHRDLRARYHTHPHVREMGYARGLRAVRADGSEVDAEIRLSPLGGGRLVVAAIRDVTEAREAELALRRSEEQLRQAQKMEVVGRMAGGIAHDFNNLLTVIQGYTEILLHQLEPDDARRPAGEEVQRAAVRAAALTRQLLAFSRRQVLQPRVVSLRVIVGDITKMLSRLIGEHIELVIDLMPETWHVKADPGQLEQIVVNLAVNARDAMPKGGTLRIATTNYATAQDTLFPEFSLAAGEWVQLTVADTGTGIDEATRQHIFEPFFTTKGPGKGTGLGLATVYGIVRQSNGHVAVTTAPGEGTTFTIWLPRTTALPAAEAPSTALVVDAAGRTILLVEDEQDVRRLARHYLEEAGYRVLEASDGVAALGVAAAHDGAIDLVVTDIVMPEMDGPDFAKGVREARPGVRVLYVSGYTEDAMVRHGLSERRIRLVEKPFTRDTLLAGVAAALAGPATDPPPPV